MSDTDAKILPWLYRDRPRVLRGKTPVNKMAALSQAFGADRPISREETGTLAEAAEALTHMIERMAEHCLKFGQIGAAAAYKEIAGQADVLAKQIEEPALDVTAP